MRDFTDRSEAGRELGEALRERQLADVVVVGLPRGGVPVAAQVARILDAPLDVIVVRKLGVPFQPELAMGAIGEEGACVVNDAVVTDARVSEAELAEVERRERHELQRRVRAFRGDRPPLPLAGSTVVVVDDGIATGATARAACRVAQARGAARVVLAVPVGPPGTRERFADSADEVLCLRTPAGFSAVGQYYRDFRPTSDAEVVELLTGDDSPNRERSPVREEEVRIAIGEAHLPGRLSLPPGARGIVVFAHGSGSSRHSPRNRYVASALVRAGLGTLLFDLLTVTEERDRGKVFDIDLLAHRLLAVDGWLRARPETGVARIGYFGASTGSAAALAAAAEPQADVAAVVSRGGRPDLAGAALARVRAPALLIVGGRDTEVLELNRAAQARLTCESRLDVVPGATHLFQEPGALETVAELTCDWFSRFMPDGAGDSDGSPEI